MKDKTYEELFAELTQITQKLNEGKITLEETMSLYERGMHLLQECARLLNRYEERVSDLAQSVLEDEDDV